MMLVKSQTKDDDTELDIIIYKFDAKGLIDPIWRTKIMFLTLIYLFVGLFRI